MPNEGEGTAMQSAEKPKILGMIMNPVEQFKKIREQPVIWIPLIILTILTVIGVWLITSNIDFANQPGMEGLDIPEDEMAMMENVAMIGGLIGGVFSPIIFILIGSLIHFIIAKIARKDVGFKQLFSLNIFVYFISVIGTLINGVAFFLTGNVQSEELFTSLNSVINADGVLGALFNSIEVFAIWGIILLAIGLQIVGRFSKGLAWGVVLAMFFIGLAFSMIGAGLQTMMGA